MTSNSTAIRNLVALTLSLAASACAATATTPETASQGEALVYSRTCQRDALPAEDCSEWQSEAVPSTPDVHPLAADTGAWECHTTGYDRQRVALSCKPAEGLPVIVTVACPGEGNTSLLEDAQVHAVHVICD